MDEPNCNAKELMSIRNTKRLDHWYNVEYKASPRVVIKRDIAHKLYQLLSLFKSSITQELDKCKKDEIRLNNDIMWFASGDKGGKWKKQHSQHVEEALGEEDELELQIRPIPRTDAGVMHLVKAPYWKIPDDVCTDKKRCHNRLNKGRMDLEYLKQVQDELVSQKSDGPGIFKSDVDVDDGVQELDYVMESLVHRIHHGSNNRADEAKLYQQIKKLNNTMEIYTAPTEPEDDVDPPWGRSHTRPALDKQQRQHQSKIVLSQLEKARTVRRGQLNLQLDRLRQKIRCMERLLEQISLRMKVAYKRGEQHNEAKSCYSDCKSLMTYVKEEAEYKSLMTYVKELARRGDIVELMQVCDRQLFDGCSKF